MTLSKRANFKAGNLVSTLGYNNQQTKRAMALVFMIPGEGRMDGRVGRQVGSRRCDGLDAGLFIAGDDCNRFALPVRLALVRITSTSR